MLGYNSVELLLNTCPSFSKLFLYAGGLLNPLTTLAKEQGGRHSVSLRRQDGNVGHFSLALSLLPSLSGEASGIIEGFLVNHEAEEIANQAERDRDYARGQRASLALLLAATCRQIRSYLDTAGTAGEERVVKAGPEPQAEAREEAGPERRRGVISVNSVLHDIYQIAMTEAESSPPVFMPIEFRRFSRSLGRQVQSALQTRGISLRFELSATLPERLSGPAPLLRHALERALLAVTGPVQGGWAVVSLTRDPNAPKSQGMARVLFSVTWSRFLQDEPGAHSDNGAPSAGQAFSDAYTTLFELPHDPEEAGQSPPENSGTLHIAAEQEVIRYLVQKMRGELLDALFTADLRSLRMIISLPWSEEEDSESPLATPEEGAQNGRGQTGADLLTSPPEPSVAMLANLPDIVGMADMPTMADIASLTEEERLAFTAETGNLAPLPEASSLELLAMNKLEEPEDYAQVATPRSGQALDILLIDDNLNNRLLFSLFLRDTQCRITEAHDAQQGVEAFQHGRFDLIFLDMEMPLMDGYQATRIIRALEADSGKAPTPIVAMTTYALPEFRRQCMIAGCSDFLSKPFTKNALLSMLDAFAQMKEGEKDTEKP